MKKFFKEVRGHLMSGISYILPLLICASLLIGIPTLIAMVGGLEMAETAPGFGRTLYVIAQAGWLGLGLINLVLAGFIAYSIADKPAMAGGFIGGALATHYNMGFLGAILAGLIAGGACKFAKPHMNFKGALGQMTPLFLLPMVSAVAVSLGLGVILSHPISSLNTALVTWIQDLSKGGGSTVFLAIVLGAMITSDLGGPINKAAWFSCNLLMVDGLFMPTVLAQIAICVPTIGYAIATLVWKRKFSSELQLAGKTNIVLGLMGITEGAIPFTMVRPLRLVPINILGGITGSVIGALFSLNASVPPIGGMFGALSVNNPIGFIIAILSGAMVVAVLSVLATDFNQKIETEDEIEIIFEEEII